MIYLDYAATTPCLPEVIDAMLPYFRTSFGNAASVDHAFGSAAKSAVDRAREQVAALCGANPEDVIFTSGATEANNLALNNNLRLITGTIEHPSIRDTAQSSSSARRVEWLATDSQGIYSIDQLNDCFNSSEPTMLSLMMVNNEIGTIQPMAELSSTARNHGAILHTDATQAVAYLALTMEHVDALSLSAHKIYGPKGVGALICKSRLRRHLSPTLYGGGHERGLRSGTLNVPGIVGFGCAADIAISERTKRTNHLTAVRSTFEDTLATIYRRKVRVNAKDSAAPHIMSITLDGVNGRALVNAVRSKVSFSLGSACATTKSEPSYVLLAIGLSERHANETIRCSFGHELDKVNAMEAAAEIANSANALLEFFAA